MKPEYPDFTLFAESSSGSPSSSWRFVLQTPDGNEVLSAADHEPDCRNERLELLAVVRGLEALPQPCRVTILTPSQYVRRGLAYGLEEWRSNGWTWEHFGQMVLVKNHDLWQRLDRALSIHQVDCRQWRFDPPHPHRPSNPVRSSASERNPWPRRPMLDWVQAISEKFLGRVSPASM